MTDKLKNNENFNISDGNVKENDISLTEKWKNDELLINLHYYIKLKNGAIRTAKYEHMVYDGERCVGFGLYHNEVEEVLTPVPSYEDWQKLQNSLEHEKGRATHYYKVLTEIEDENDKLDEMCKHWSMQETERTMECVKLKELLKECKEFVGLAGYLALDTADDNTVERCNKLLTKINEVLK